MLRQPYRLQQNGALRYQSLAAAVDPRMVQVPCPRLQIKCLQTRKLLNDAMKRFTALSTPPRRHINLARPSQRNDPLERDASTRLNLVPELIEDCTEFLTREFRFTRSARAKWGFAR